MEGGGDIIGKRGGGENMKKGRRKKRDNKEIRGQKYFPPIYTNLKGKISLRNEMGGGYH